LGEPRAHTAGRGLGLCKEQPRLAAFDSRSRSQKVQGGAVAGWRMERDGCTVVLIENYRPAAYLLGLLMKRDATAEVRTRAEIA
jgi:hypothetical protein